MDRRELFTTLGATSLGMMALSASTTAAATPRDKVHETCLDACGSCARTCDETYVHCFTALTEGKKEHAKAMRLLGDCAGFCALSACMIAKDSPLMAYSCQSCAEACKVTAAEVSKFDSPEMKLAVKKLNECEKSCRAMVEHMGHGHAH